MTDQEQLLALTRERDALRVTLERAVKDAPVFIKSAFDLGGKPSGEKVVKEWVNGFADMVGATDLFAKLDSGFFRKP